MFTPRLCRILKKDRLWNIMTLQGNARFNAPFLIITANHYCCLELFNCSNPPLLDMIFLASGWTERFIHQ